MCFTERREILVVTGKLKGRTYKVLAFSCAAVPCQEMVSNTLSQF